MQIADYSIRTSQKETSALIEQMLTALELIEGQTALRAYKAALKEKRIFEEQVQPYSRRFLEAMTYLAWFAGCTREEDYPQCEAALCTAHQQLRYIMGKPVAQITSSDPAAADTDAASLPDAEDEHNLLMYFLHEARSLNEKPKGRQKRAANDGAFRQAIAPWVKAAGSEDRVSAEAYFNEAQKIKTRLASFTAAYDFKEALQYAMKLIMAIIQTDESYLDAQTCCTWGRQVRTLFDDWRSSRGAALSWVDYSPDMDARIRVTYSFKEEHTFPALFYSAAGSAVPEMLRHGGRRN